MQVRGGFILVTPVEEGKMAFWLRASDVVAISHDVKPTMVFRHATVPVAVLEDEQEVLEGVFEADGRKVLFTQGAISAETD